MRSIERYLLAWILASLGLGALIMAVVAYRVTLDEMNEVYDADLRHVAEALGSYRQDSFAPDFDPAHRAPQRADVPDPSEIVTITWTREGRQVYSSDPRVAIPFMDHEALSRMRVDGQEWIVYTDVNPNGVAQAAQRAVARRETAAEAASQIFPIMVGLALAVAGLMVFALRRGLAPLDAASRDIAARSAKSLTPLALDPVPREISPLVQSINGLMQRLSDAFAMQRRFVADAAHELRTPMTALRLQVQGLRRARDAQAHEESLAELESGIARSQRLVEQLLQVARAEPDGEPTRRDAVDLGELVRTVVGSLSLKAERHGIDLGARTPARTIVLGDGEQLTVLLNNLVENALRYTPAGGVVDVEAGMLSGHAVLTVSDDGPGIPPAEHARVFDRFYRGTDASALARDPGGSGLGLAIVRAIAERHAARVGLRTPRSGRGLEVQVVFGVG